MTERLGSTMLKAAAPHVLTQQFDEETVVTIMLMAVVLLTVSTALCIFETCDRYCRCDPVPPDTRSEFEKAYERQLRQSANVARMRSEAEEYLKNSLYPYHPIVQRQYRNMHPDY